MTPKQLHADIIARIERGGSFRTIIASLGYTQRQLYSILTPLQVDQLQTAMHRYGMKVAKRRTMHNQLQDLRRQQGRQTSQHMSTMTDTETRIMNYIATQRGIETTDILLHSRLRVVVEARQMAQYVFVKQLGYTLERTGEKLCVYAQDHSTVLHGVSMAVNLAQTDDSYNDVLTAACRLAAQIKPIAMPHPKITSITFSHLNPQQWTTQQQAAS